MIVVLMDQEASELPGVPAYGETQDDAIARVQALAAA